MRRLLLSAAKILVSAALMYVALRKTNFSDLLSRLDIASLGWVGLAIAATLLQIVFGAFRWREISTDCGAPLTVIKALRYYLIGSFFNQTLPSAIGGDAVRLWLVARGGAGWRAATYSILIERTIGLIALAVLIAGTLPWTLRLIDNPEGRIALLFIESIALLAGITFLVIGKMRWRWLQQWAATRHIHAGSEIASRLIFSRGSGLTIIVLSLLIHILAVVIAWCVARSISAPVQFGQIFQLIPPVMLITMMPISIAGWGVREATMGLAFGYAGLAINEGVNVSLLFGAVFFIVGAFGGLIWIFSAEKAERGRAPIEVPE